MKTFWKFFATLFCSGTVALYGAESCSPGDGHDHAAEKTPAPSAAPAHDDHDHAAEDGHDHATETAEEHAGHDHAAESADAHDEHDHAAEDGHDHAAETEDAHAGHDHAAGEAETEVALLDRGVELTAAQRALIELSVRPAKAGRLERTVLLNGVIRFDQEQIAGVMPRLDGFVNEIVAKLGTEVKKDQVLAVLHSAKRNQLYSDYFNAAELVKLTLAENERNQTLIKQHVVSERELQQSSQAYAEAKIRLHAATDELLALDLPIPASHEEVDGKNGDLCNRYELKAPMAGTVIERNIVLGEKYAEDSEKISFVIANLDQMNAELQARQSEVTELRVGESVTLTVDGVAGVFHGPITYIAPMANPTSRTFSVYVALDNHERKLSDGMSVIGRIVPTEETETVIVPRSAVVLVDGVTIVFVPDGQGYKPRRVSVGRSTRSSSEIVAGLKAGEEFVAQGAFELKAILLTAGVDPHAGHGH